MYSEIASKEYLKSLKRIRSSGKFKTSAQESLKSAIRILASGKVLPSSYKDHRLTGELKEYRECHIQGDLLLVYQIKEELLVLLLIDIGSHSYLDL